MTTTVVDEVLQGVLREVRDRLAVLEGEDGGGQTAQAQAVGITGHEFLLTAYGRQLADEIATVAPDPVLLLGPAGFGKSALARYVSAGRGHGGFSAVNFDAGMSLHPLIGQWVPRAGEQGVTVEWVDGTLTAAVKDGSTFLAEELTRAPQELLSRLFGLLDSDFRSWDVIEQGAHGVVSISPDFFLLATGNPAAQGYSGARRLDAALASRFAAIITVDQPIAPEREILAAYVPGYVADAMLRFAEDCRPSGGHGDGGKHQVSTRNLVQVARHIQAGIAPERAVAIAVVPKFPDSEGIQQLADQHLKNLQPPAPEAQVEAVDPTVGVEPYRKNIGTTEEGEPIFKDIYPTSSTYPSGSYPAPAAAAAPKTATRSVPRTKRTARSNGCAKYYLPAGMSMSVESTPSIVWRTSQFVAFIAAVDALVTTGATAGQAVYGWSCNCAVCLRLRDGWHVKIRPATAMATRGGTTHPGRPVSVAISPGPNGSSLGGSTRRGEGGTGVVEAIRTLVKDLTGV